jgi:NAD(P)H-dependent flavin oxidoreductase YrpB (nitropropane dioxygenase family)
VVAAVSKAGGFGVLGAATMTPEELETELTWIDEHVDGKPYGVDLIVPNKMEGRDETPSPEEMIAKVPGLHRDFARGILEQHQIDTAELTDEVLVRRATTSNNLRPAGAEKLLEIAFSHPIKLIANALGIPPQIMLDMGHERGVKVAALVGTKAHAVNQMNVGVDLLVVAGGEAGGHTGQVSTMVLVPEVYAAVQEHAKGGPTMPILAAGGIATGRQMAAAMAMGAEGVWCGSVWLTTTEAETSEVVKAKMLQASSSDTVRSRSRTGKPSRQLRSPWTDAWEAEGAPEPLPMPLQSMVSEPALAAVRKAAEGGHEGAKALDTYWVGQGVGLMNQTRTAGQTVQDFKEDFLAAYERLNEFMS